VPRAPLTAAAAAGAAACVRVLLEAGAPVDGVADGDGGTALHAAADSGDVESIEALLGALHTYTY